MDADVHKIQNVLQDNSTSKYYVEFDHFHYNHLTCGIIALHRLNAPEDNVHLFIDYYARRLESKENHKEDVKELTPDQLPELLGKHKSFYSLVAYYDQLLCYKYNNSLTSLIQNEYPKLAKGMMSFALHSLIHIGYGLAANHIRTVVEGFAISHYSFYPVNDENLLALKSIGDGELDIFTVLDEIRNDAVLANVLQECVKPGRYPELENNTSHFLLKAAVLSQYHGKIFAAYCNKIKISEDVLQAPEYVNSIGKWLVHSALYVYASSEVKNYFYLLHGVTGAWSLTQILPVLQKEDFLLAVKIFFCCLLIVYAAQGCPKLLTEKELADEIKEASLIDYEQIIFRAVNKISICDPRIINFDEHIYKLLQVCNEIRDEQTTPELSTLYKRAALRALDHEFTYE